MQSEELNRRVIYNKLHQQDELRFPLEDYPVFYKWLNIPQKAQCLKLLDVACGQGFFLEVIEKADTFIETHGLDFSSAALDIARNRLMRTELELASVYKMPYSDFYFDYIVCLGSLEHFDKPDKSLIEMIRCLKPTGKVMIIVPNQYYIGSIWKAAAYGLPEDQGQEGVTYFRTLSEWEDLFLKIGFDILGIRGYNGEHHIAWYFKRVNNEITSHEILWRDILNRWLRPFIPLSLSQCFVFMLRPQHC